MVYTFFFGKWKQDSERATGRTVIANANFSIMHHHNAFTEIEADSCACLTVYGILGLFSGLVETVEYLCDILFGNSRSGVADTEIERLFFIVFSRKGGYI